MADDKVAIAIGHRMPIVSGFELGGKLPAPDTDSREQLRFTFSESEPQPDADQGRLPTAKARGDAHT